MINWTTDTDFYQHLHKWLTRITKNFVEARKKYPKKKICLPQTTQSKIRNVCGQILMVCKMRVNRSDSSFDRTKLLWARNKWTKPQGKNPWILSRLCEGELAFYRIVKKWKRRIIMTNRWTARLEERRNRPLNMIHYISEVSSTSGSKTDWCDWSPSTIV